VGDGAQSFAFGLAPPGGFGRLGRKGCRHESAQVRDCGSSRSRRRPPASPLRRFAGQTASGRRADTYRNGRRGDQGRQRRGQCPSHGLQQAGKANLVVELTMGVSSPRQALTCTIAPSNYVAVLGRHGRHPERPRSCRTRPARPLGRCQLDARAECVGTWRRSSAAGCQGGLHTARSPGSSAGLHGGARRYRHVRASSSARTARSSSGLWIRLAPSSRSRNRPWHQC